MEVKSLCLNKEVVLWLLCHLSPPNTGTRSQAMSCPFHLSFEKVEEPGNAERAHAGSMNSRHVDSLFFLSFFCSLLLLQLSFLSLPFHHPFSFSSVLIFFLLCSSLLVFSPFYLPVFIFPVSLFLFQSFALLPFFPLGSCLSLFLSPFSFLFAPVLFITFLRSFFTLCRFS